MNSEFVCRTKLPTRTFILPVPTPVHLLAESGGDSHMRCANRAAADLLSLVEMRSEASQGEHISRVPAVTTCAVAPRCDHASRALGDPRPLAEQVCHIVQVAVSQRRILGYLEGSMVPFGRSVDCIKDRTRRWHPGIEYVWGPALGNFY